MSFPEPPLQRSVVMRNTLKHLEGGLFTHSPSKRIFLDLDQTAALNNLHLSPEARQFADGKMNIDNQMDESFAAGFGITAAGSDILGTNVDHVDMDQLSPSPPAAGQSTFKREDNSINGEYSFEDENVVNLANAIVSFQTPIEKNKLSTLSDVDLQSLVSCTSNPFNLKDSSIANPSTTAHPHVDELDNIMQVLVGM